MKPKAQKSESQSAIIAGATGLVGQSLLRLIKKQDLYDEIVILTRRPLTNSWAQDNQGKEKIVQLDFANLEDYKEKIRGDHLFIALGTTQKKAGSKEAFHQVDYGLPVQLCDIAHKNGARRFAVVSSVGADASSFSYYLKTKGEMEETLQAMALPQLHILRPSLLLGNRGELRITEELGKLVDKIMSPLMTGKLKRYRGIAAEQVAAFMLEIMQQESPGHHIWESEKIKPTP